MYNAVDFATYDDDDKEDEGNCDAEYVFDEDGEIEEKVSPKSVGPFSHSAGGGKRNVRTARSMS